jgi:hypothetical protein
MWECVIGFIAGFIAALPLCAARAGLQDLGFMVMYTVHIIWTHPMLPVYWHPVQGMGAVEIWKPSVTKPAGWRQFASAIDIRASQQNMHVKEQIQCMCLPHHL